MMRTSFYFCITVENVDPHEEARMRTRLEKLFSDEFNKEIEIDTSYESKDQEEN